MPTSTIGSPPRLFIIGLGIKIPGHVTIEAHQAMSLCSKLFSIIREPPDLWLPTGPGKNIPVTSLMPMYVEGGLRTDNYDRVAELVLGAAQGPETVGYVTYGNPMAYDSVAQSLAQNAARSGIPFRVIPGISSVDTILCDLAVDMAPGLQLIEASWMLANGIQLRADLPALIVQIGTFGSLRAHYRKPPQGVALAGLVDYMCRTYPPSHRVFLVRSSGQESQRANMKEVAMGDLCSVASEDLQGASMYVPVVAWPQPDPEMIERMRHA